MDTQAITPSSILVVDDEPVNFAVIEALLANHNYQLHYASSGQDAVDGLDRVRPDLILLDVMMPEVNGIDVCKQIKALPRWSAIPIIMVTALSSRQDLAACLAAGADDFISKPVERLELGARVQSMLRISHQQQQLVKTLQQLKSAQAQMIQTEKMSGLGRLVTGIVHEINNPINFIQGNLGVVSVYSQKFLELVQLHQKYSYPASPEIVEFEKAVDLESLKQDYSKLMSTMQLGIRRVQEIIKSLRTFSQVDGNERRWVDIHQGLEGTLLILQCRLKSKKHPDGIQIVRSYGQIPQVLCYPGQLNQAFLNILVNAIEALETGNGCSCQCQAPTITLSTSIQDGKVTIAIADNGPGIPTALRSQIFDPFFTTKPVGAGTGMGLSMSYQIINEGHGGTLDCVSHPDQGTKFVIQLPMLDP